MIGGQRIPAHVVGVRRAKDGIQYHAFIRIRQRDAWMDEDPQSRECIRADDPKVLRAWKSFSVILHPDDVTPMRLV